MVQKKFITIYEQLKNQILTEVYRYSEQLPSENELVTTYGTSRETVRKALDLLANDGMIQKIRGKGSVVIYQGITEFPFSELISFKEIQHQLGLKHHTELVINEEINAADAEKVQFELGLEKDDKLIHVIRTRSIEGKVKILDEDFFVKSIVGNISDEVARQSIYDYLENDLQREISYSSKSITFEPFSKIDDEVFGDINPPYTATVRSTVYLKDTTQFQYNISKHIATDFKFKEFSRRRENLIQ